MDNEIHAITNCHNTTFSRVLVNYSAPLNIGRGPVCRKKVSKLGPSGHHIKPSNDCTLLTNDECLLQVELATCL